MSSLLGSGWMFETIIFISENTNNTFCLHNSFCVYAQKSGWRVGDVCWLSGWGHLGNAWIQMRTILDSEIDESCFTIHWEKHEFYPHMCERLKYVFGLCLLFCIYTWVHAVGSSRSRRGPSHQCGVASPGLRTSKQRRHN